MQKQSLNIKVKKYRKVWDRYHYTGKLGILHVVYEI